MKLSLVIPAKDVNDPKLKELLRSIDEQDFIKSDLEVLVITEGSSESAKAIGIRRAKGDVIGFLASDNELIDKDFLREHYKNAVYYGACYPIKYHYSRTDDILNRYFSLFGGNDPISFYMGKNDRWSYLGASGNMQGSIGDNGYFIRKDLIEKTDLDNYYHIDNAIEAKALTAALSYTIWHKTGGNLFKFLSKRYCYGLEHAFNKNRRWHLVDFRSPTDTRRLAWFIFAGITLIQPLSLSLRGYLKIRDIAWFLHPVMCLATIFLYAVLTSHVLFNRLFQSLSAPMDARRA